MRNLTLPRQPAGAELHGGARAGERIARSLGERDHVRAGAAGRAHVATLGPKLAREHRRRGSAMRSRGRLDALSVLAESRSLSWRARERRTGRGLVDSAFGRDRRSQRPGRLGPIVRGAGRAAQERRRRMARHRAAARGPLQSLSAHLSQRGRGARRRVSQSRSQLERWRLVTSSSAARATRSASIDARRTARKYARKRLWCARPIVSRSSGRTSAGCWS